MSDDLTPLSPSDARTLAYRFGCVCMIVGFLCGLYFAAEVCLVVR